MAHIRTVRIDRAGAPYLLVLALALLAWAIATAWQSDALENMIARLAELDEQGAPKTVFKLTTDTWTHFEINPPDGLVSILATAAIPQNQPDQDPTDINFGIEYTLPGQKKPKQHYFASSVVWLRSPHQAEAVPAARLLAPHQSVVSTTQSLTLTTPASGALRLRMLPSPGVDAVIVRVFTHERLPESMAEREWIRLSASTRYQLSAPLVFPPDLLEPQIKQRLILSRWTPVGPQGVEGQDYISARLKYEPQDELTRWHDDFVGFGLVSGPEQTTVLPLKTPSGSVKIKITAVDGSSKVTAKLTYEKGDSSPPENEIAVVEESLQRPWKKGWITVNTDKPALVRAYDGETGEELTPELLRSLVWGFSQDKPLTYPLSHVVGESTPLKVDLRKIDLRSNPPLTRSFTAQWELLNENAETIKRGTVTFEPKISHTDIRDDMPYDSWVSEAHSFYLLAPEEARLLRLRAPNPMWASVYTRPLHLRQITRVPADYQPWTEDPDRQPLWFSLQPDWEVPPERLMIRRQPQTPERDPDILAGNFNWQQWYPEEAAPGAWFLLPRDEFAATRSDALSNIFFRIEPNQTQHLQIAPRPDGAEPRVELMYKHASPNSDIQVDGLSIPLLRPLPRQGTVELPPLAPGRHRIRISDSSKGNWLVNQLADRQGGFLKVYAQRINRGEKLHYQVGAGAENRTLSIRAILPVSSSSADLVVSASPAKLSDQLQLPDWTVADRIFRFTPSAEDPSIAHEQIEGAWRDAGVGFLPIGSDRSNTDTTLVLELNGADTAYVSLFELTPGLAEQSTSRKDRPSNDF